MLHTIRNACLTVTATEDGAQLQSILGVGGTEYLWQGDPAYWKNRAPNLFPYIARLTEGCYFLDGERHEMRIHGIAPYRQFTLVSKEESKMVFELLYDAQTMEEYPRRFAFRVIYELVGNTLNIVYEVENKDQRTMYFGLGGHPGFRVPLAPGLRFEDYRLRFSESCQPNRVGFTAECFRNGENLPYPLVNDTIIPLHHHLFDEDAIVLENVCREVTLESPLDSRSVTVSYPQMPYVGFWHRPESDAPYVCIEPWCSLPAKAGAIAVFEEQEDLLQAAPGETYRNLWTITVR